MAGSSSQNQGMLIAMIVFVILMVISMGLAVLFMSQTRELDQQVRTKSKALTDSEVRETALLTELTNLQKMVMAAPPNSEGAGAELAKAYEARYAADLQKFGKRLNAVDNAAVVSTYTQMLDAALTTLEKKQMEVNAANAATAKANADKDALDAFYKNQVSNFEMTATKANEEKAAALKSQADTEAKLRAEQEAHIVDNEKNVAAVEKVRAEGLAKLTASEAKIGEMQRNIDDLNKALEHFRKTDYASSYDGKITRVNPTARTVWVNVGTFDNLKKHVSFSVQPQGVPPGSTVPPKAKIEVVELLGDRLAECRIVEDDLNNPIAVGDNIFTSLWDPGQKTRFGFAGKIDLNDDGTEDMDQVHSMVAKAGGQIDVEVVEGQIKGELSIYTRYLVLGAIPADKNSAAAYNALLDQATKLGVQRIPLPVFMDQIGIPKRERGRVVFGGGSQTGTVAMDPPDGGPRVSPGRVSNYFRMPPTPTPATQVSPSSAYSRGP
jgi:hypothetical protein